MFLISGLVLGNSQTICAAKKPSLSFKKLTLNVGQKKKIAIKNKNKRAVYTFRSSSKKTAAVSSKGVIIAKKQGRAKITVLQRLKKGTKKSSKKIGVITVICKKKPIDKPSISPQPTITPQVTHPSIPQNTPEVSPQSDPPATLHPTETPRCTETPAPTPDLYTKKVMTVTVSDTELHSVEGNTCHVDMQYFTGEVTGECLTGKITGEGTVVVKAYKDGETRLCSRYMISGTDSEGKKCSMFIEDNGTIDESGKAVTTPIIITDSDALSWLETADLQGRITDEGDGTKTIDILWNESNTEPVSPPPVIRPDESQTYPNEIFTFTIDIGSTTSVTGSTGKASMIHFGGASDCSNFKGKIVSDCVDTRLKFNGQIETLSARYILSGTDANGNPCKIYVENNGIDDNGMVTEPTIITDNPDFAWVESAKLHGTVSWSPKLTIHVAAADEQ